MSRRRGSALVEAAVAGGLASALLAGSVFIGRVSLAGRRAHALARLAAAISAVGVPSDILEAELRDYAARLNAPEATWVLDRYAGSPSARFYRLAEAAVTVAVPRPRLLGGGRQPIAERAVVEEDRP